MADTVSLALIIGFRPVAGLVEWIIVMGVLLLYMLVITWFAVLFGMIAKTPDGAGSFSFVILLLPYLSSGFVPTETMPTVLRVIAEKQPLTPIIESLRSLFLYSSANRYILPAVLWCIGLLLVSYILSMQIYKHKARG